MEEFNRVLFYGLGFWKALAIVKVDQVGSPVILASLSAFGAVSGEVPYFSALETGVRLVSRGGCVALEVVLQAVSLIAVRVLSSAEVVASVVPSVVSPGWCSVPVYVHRDRSVIHPTRSIG